MLATLGKTAARALFRAAVPRHKRSTLITPGPDHRRTFSPVPDSLLDAYIAHLGGDPRAYRGIVPPHFFPHWVMPVAAEAIKNLPYPILRVVNAGCRMQVDAMLPRQRPVQVRAHLANIEDDGVRALITQRAVVETEDTPNALSVEIYAYVPLRDRGNGKPNGNGKSGASKPAAASEKRAKPRVPQGSREIDFMKLSADAGLSFAKLTGDFNPIHWLPAYAKTAGFRNVVLHGFGTFARCCESLNRGLLGGDVRKLRVLDAKFTRPLVLPHAVGVYVHGREVFVGDGVEGPAYMSGRFGTGE